jgi:hypothetical protein
MTLFIVLLLKVAGIRLPAKVFFVTSVKSFVSPVVKESKLNHRGHKGIHEGHKG